MRNRAFLKVVLLGLLTFAFVPGLAGAASQGQDLTGMLASAAAERATAVSGAVISVVPANHDFGRVNVGSSSGTFDLTIHNTGAATLNISAITNSSPSNFSASAASLTVAAGGTTLLHTSYHPASGSGGQTDNVQIMSNADNGTFSVLLSGVANNAPSFSPPLATDYNLNAFVPFSLTASATDPEGDALTWSISSVPSLPVGATFDGNSGALNWTPGAADAGNYAVTVNVTDGVATTPGNFTLHVTADNHPPVANPGGPYVGADDFPLAFDGSGSTTGDPGSPQSLTYLWDFGDGDTGTGATPSHTYHTPGNYLVTLTVTDNGSPPLSNSATTAAEIRAFVPARIILERDYLKRTGNKGHVLLGMELLSHSIADIDPTSIRMSGTFAGAGTPISALTKGTAIGDIDANLVNDFDVFFNGTDVDQLLHGVANGAAVTLNINAVTLAGSLPIAGRISIIATDTGPYPANPPVVTAPATATGAEGSPISFTVSASDPDGQAIDTWSATQLEGSSITLAPDVQSVTFNWTPSVRQRGTYRVAFVASNLFSATVTTTITVTDPTSPVLAQPANMTVTEGVIATQTITATDADGDNLTFTKVSGPGFYTVVGQSPQSAFIRLAPGFTDAGTYSAQARASDGGSSSTKSFTITVNNVNQPPVIDGPPANMLVAAGRTASQSINAFDVDNDPITFSLSAGPTWVTVTTIPPSPFNGLISAAPPASTATGDYAATVMASAIGGSDSKSFNIHVHNADAVPVVTAPAGVGVAPKKKLTVDVSAADPDGDPLATLTADLSGLPHPNDAVFTSTDPAAGTLTWTPRNQDQSGANPYVVTFTSSNWLSGSAQTRITVTPQTNHAPVVSGAPATLSGTHGTAINFVVSASDADANPIVSFTANGAAMDSGGTFTPNGTNTSGTFAWTPLVTAGVWPVTFFASDGVLTGAATTNITISLPGGSASLSASLAARSLGGVWVSPNPLNPKANLTFTMAKTGYARVRMYDLSGRLVRTLMDEPHALAGLHTVVIDGRGTHGEKLASGIYYYRVETAERTVDGKFTILK